MNTRLPTTEAALARAEQSAYEHQLRKAADEKRAHETWNVRSHHRAVENKLDQRLGNTIGRIDDTYLAEVPLTIGWNSHEDGTTLAYVSLGGVDVSEYLPPDVMADIQSHVNYLWDEEQGRTS